MDEPIGYVVVTYNQASGQPDIDPGTELGMLEEARIERDAAEHFTNQIGRHERHVIGVVHLLEDDDA